MFPQPPFSSMFCNRLLLLFPKKKIFRPPVQGKVEIFARHCMISDASCRKKRPPGFSHEKCFENFLGTLDRSKANVTFVLDAAKGDPKTHFLSRHPDEKVITIEAGTEAISFLKLLDIIAQEPIHPDSVVYIVEDDYLHSPGWIDLLLEGFSLPADYVTLYDHRDKYFLPMYQNLQSRIWVAKSCHWRSVPSTTNTFAARYGTLMADLAEHRRFSRKGPITRDHQKFLCLGRRGRVVISPMPGASTHADAEFASPFFNS